LRSFGISSRLYALLGIALLAMLATEIYAIVQERSALIAERRFMLSSMTESATSIFALYHEMEKQGLLTREEAQTRQRRRRLDALPRKRILLRLDRRGNTRSA